MASNRETVRVPMVVSCWSDANKARRDRPQSIVSLACFSISHDIGSAIASPPPVSKTRRRTPQGDAELMTKKQVLGFKPAPRLEQVDKERSE
jgi:hypothetical protein